MRSDDAVNENTPGSNVSGSDKYTPSSNFISVYEDYSVSRFRIRSEFARLAKGEEIEAAYSYIYEVCTKIRESISGVYSDNLYLILNEGFTKGFQTPVDGQSKKLMAYADFAWLSLVEDSYIRNRIGLDQLLGIICNKERFSSFVKKYSIGALPYLRLLHENLPDKRQISDLIDGAGLSETHAKGLVYIFLKEDAFRHDAMIGRRGVKEYLEKIRNLNFSSEMEVKIASGTVYSDESILSVIARETTKDYVKVYMVEVDKFGDRNVVKKIVLDKDEKGVSLFANLINQANPNGAASLLGNTPEDIKAALIFDKDNQGRTIFNYNYNKGVVQSALLMAAGGNKEEAVKSLLAKDSEGTSYVISSLLSGDHDTFSAAFDLIAEIANSESLAELLQFKDDKSVPFLFEPATIVMSESIAPYVNELIRRDQKLDLLKKVFSAKDANENFWFSKLDGDGALTILDAVMKADNTGNAFVELLTISRGDGASWLSDAFEKLDTAQQVKFLGDLLKRSEGLSEQLIHNAVISMVEGLKGASQAVWMSDRKALDRLQNMSLLPNDARVKIFLAKDNNGRSAIWEHTSSRARSLYKTLWPKGAPDYLVVELFIDYIKNSAERNKSSVNTIKSILTNLFEFVGNRVRPNGLLNITAEDGASFMFKAYEQTPEVLSVILQTLKNSKVTGKDFIASLLMKDQNGQYWLTKLPIEKQKAVYHSLCTSDLFSIRDTLDPNYDRFNSYFNLIKGLRFSNDEVYQILMGSQSGERSAAYILKTLAGNSSALGLDNYVLNFIDAVKGLHLSNSQYVGVLTQNNNSGESLLRVAVDNNNVEFVEKFLRVFDHKELLGGERYLLVRAPNVQGVSALRSAAENRRYDIVHAIVKNIEALDISDDQKKELFLAFDDNANSLLYTAIKLGDKRLIKEYVDVINDSTRLTPQLKFEILNSIKGDTESSLTAALKSESPELVIELLKALTGSALTTQQRYELLAQKDASGYSALGLAVKKGLGLSFKKIVQSILEQGFSEDETVKLLRSPNIDNISLLSTAIRGNKKNYVDTLFELIAASNLSSDARFSLMSEKNSSGKSLLYTVVDIDAFDSLNSFVEWLPKMGFTAEQKLKLLQNGSADNQSILLAAIKTGRKEQVERVIKLLSTIDLSREQRADIFRGGTDGGDSPIALALQKSNTEIIKMLVKGALSLGGEDQLWERAINPMASNNSRSPLLVDIARGNFSLRSYLAFMGELSLSHKATISALTEKLPEGRSALAEALYTGNNYFASVIFSMLRNDKALKGQAESILKVDSEGLKQGFREAVSKGNNDLVDTYIEGVAGLGLPENTVVDLIRSEGKDGKSAIEIALGLEDMEVIDTILTIFDPLSRSLEPDIVKEITKDIDYDAYIKKSPSKDFTAAVEVLKELAGQDWSADALFGKPTTSHSSMGESELSLGAGFMAETNQLKGQWSAEIHKLIDAHGLKGWNADFNCEDIVGGVKVIFVKPDTDEKKVVEVTDAAAVKVFKDVKDISSKALDSNDLVSTEGLKFAALISSQNEDHRSGFQDYNENVFVQKFATDHSLDLQKASDLFKSIVSGLSEPSHADFSVHRLDGGHTVRIACGL